LKDRGKAAEGVSSLGNTLYNKLWTKGKEGGCKNIPDLGPRGRMKRQENIKGGQVPER